MGETPLIPGRSPLPPEIEADWEEKGVRSRLAAARRARGISQEELASRIGVPIASYRRLENGGIDNPRLGQLVNCAIALEVELTSLIEDDWLEWSKLREHGPSEPPDKSLPGRRWEWPQLPPAP